MIQSSEFNFEKDINRKEIKDILIEMEDKILLMNQDSLKDNDQDE